MCILDGLFGVQPGDRPCVKHEDYVKILQDIDKNRSSLTFLSKNPLYKGVSRDSSLTSSLT